MATKMDSWRDKRKEWTTARDGAHVKKGAVRGVSLGDSLDRIYKSSAKGYRPLLGAIAAAQKDLKTYQDKGGKSVAGVATWLNTLGKDLSALKRDAEADAALLLKFVPYMNNFHAKSVPGTPDHKDASHTRDLMQKDTTGKTTWQNAAMRTKMYEGMPAVVKQWSEAVKFLETVAFKVKLPGKDAEYAYIKGMLADYKTGRLTLSNYLKCKSFDDHADNEKQGRVTMHEIAFSPPKWTAAAKSLLG